MPPKILTLLTSIFKMSATKNAPPPIVQRATANTSALYLVISDAGGRQGVDHVVADAGITTAFSALTATKYSGRVLHFHGDTGATFTVTANDGAVPLGDRIKGTSGTFSECILACILEADNVTLRWYVVSGVGAPGGSVPASSINPYEQFHMMFAAGVTTLVVTPSHSVMNVGGTATWRGLEMTPNFSNAEGQPLLIVNASPTPLTLNHNDVLAPDPASRFWMLAGIDLVLAPGESARFVSGNSYSLATVAPAQWIQLM